ncbi:MAG: hypothetical protein IJE45_01385 [Bacilli bacterium]|nr:hypothetical protein [Bacilli bacterium]
MNNNLFNIRIGKETREVICSSEKELADAFADLFSYIMTNNIKINSLSEMEEGLTCSCEVEKDGHKELATFYIDYELGNVVLFGAGCEIEDCPFSFDNN